MAVANVEERLGLKKDEGWFGMLQVTVRSQGSCFTCTANDSECGNWRGKMLGAKILYKPRNG